MEKRKNILIFYRVQQKILNPINNISTGLFYLQVFDAIGLEFLMYIFTIT